MIDASEIPYAPPVYPEDLDFAFITVDLAISDQTHAHKTTVNVHANYDDRMQIVQSDGFKGMDPVALFDFLVDTAFKWGVCCIGIESVAYQASLQYIYPHFCREREIPNLLFVPLSASGHKMQRIVTWTGMLKKKEYYLTQGDIVLTEELLNYDKTKPKANDDDFIDGAAYGPQMLERYMTEILMFTTMQAVPDQPKTIYAVSSV